MSDYLPPDYLVREEALNPDESFIVQAPAGSGKTHLLIQRYLRLLAGVEQPEQIIAITFTVKAAAEMRERVLGALNKARAGIRPEKAHEKSMADLAEAAVARDIEQGWDLEHFPARLRITTIDSLNSRLCGAAPLIAGGLSLNTVSDKAQQLYTTAARRLLALMSASDEQTDEQIDPHGAAVSRLLSHMDNNVERFETLICGMLGRREQWLPIIGSGKGLAEQREELEACLEDIVMHEIRVLDELFPFEPRRQLPELLQGAASVLAAKNPDNDIALWLEATAFPKAESSDLPLWQQLANALLTNDDDWRKAGGIDVRRGFPPKTSEKQAFVDVLEGLKDVPELEAQLALVRTLPATRFSEEQWATLLDLLMVLPLSVAQLKLVFAEAGETDFTEISTEARTALGHEDAPSDLALAMECRLQHILMDEFQDTSVAQADLLEKLTIGWQPGDGHSLFLVGDPMQSIYRFRQAEVGLFLNVAANGIGQLRPKAVKLTANFRSTPTVVNWVNSAFSVILPEEDDPTIGAVKFSPGEAVSDDVAGSEVRWLVQQTKDKSAEAEEVVSLIERLQQDDPGQSIGILVRGRSHAAKIAPLLRERGIPFAGADLEHMSDIPLVLDLVALTRALLHPADRLAWTALLRGPWCGLALEDLHVLLAPDRKAAVWELMKSAIEAHSLSADGLKRLERFQLLIGDGYRRRGRLALCDWIEGVWLSLAGPVVARDGDDLKAAEAYFEFLEEQTVGDDIPDTAGLLKLLSEKPVSFSSASARLQIMTVHKSKGLEFDSVILPGLSRATRGSDKPVLQWKEVLRPGGGKGLLLAPIDRYGSETDPLYALISGIDKQQDAAERARLLYVATTRARERLYLFAELHLSDEGEVKSPPSGTLAECMYDFICSSADVAVLPDPEDAEIPAEEADWVQPKIKRLPVGWHLPEAGDPVATAGRFEIPTPLEPVTFDWAGTMARHVGTVVHSALERFAEAGVENIDRESEVARYTRELSDLGVGKTELPVAVRRVSDAVKNSLEDARGSWIIRRDHKQAANELPVTVWENGRPVERVIDRTFVCEQGNRWVIDYKSSSHQGGGLDAFLDNEVVRYKEQLHAYRDALQALYPDAPEPVRMALYFPNLAAFREVT